jgi:heterotetrameric sarcosine oxidase delta subunit
VTGRPAAGEDGPPPLRELTDYVYFRDNVAGVQREWWQHRTGCGEWFVAERDTRTNEVLTVSLPEPLRTEEPGLVGPDPAGGAQTGGQPGATGGEGGAALGA